MIQSDGNTLSGIDDSENPTYVKNPLGSRIDPAHKNITCTEHVHTGEHNIMVSPNFNMLTLDDYVENIGELEKCLCKTCDFELAEGLENQESDSPDEDVT